MYDMTLGKNVTLIKITNKKKHLSCPMFLIKVNISFNQCKHFSQVEPFESYDFLNTCSEKNVNFNIVSLFLVRSSFTSFIRFKIHYKYEFQ